MLVARQLLAQRRQERFDPLLALLEIPLGAGLERFEGLARELEKGIGVGVERLARDARSSNRAIARELAVTEGTIRTRIRRLLDEKIIRITAVSNVNRLREPVVGVGVDDIGGPPRRVSRRSGGWTRTTDTAIMSRLLCP